MKLTVCGLFEAVSLILSVAVCVPRMDNRANYRVRGIEHYPGSRESSLGLLHAIGNDSAAHTGHRGSLVYLLVLYNPGPGRDEPEMAGVFGRRLLANLSGRTGSFEVANNGSTVSFRVWPEIFELAAR